MRFAVSSSLVAVMLSLAGCPAETPPVIVEGEGAGEGEGEGEAGEGEGEAVVVGDCDALEDAEFGDAIDLVVARSRHAAVLLNDGTVMLIGGEDDTFAPVTDVEIVDAVAGTSTAAPPLNVARYDHAAVTLPTGNVVVAGGFNGQLGHLTSIEVFDGTAWTVIGDLDEARAGVSGFLVDDKAVFFGGQNSATIPTTAVSVDEADTVEVVAGVNIGANRRSHAAAQRDDGSVVVVGGFFTDPIADVTSFDAGGSVVLPSIPGPRRQAAAAATAKGVVVTGGIGASGFLDDIAVFDGTQWAKTGTLRTPRASPVAAVIDNCVAVCGGFGGEFADLVDFASCEGIDENGVSLPMVDLPFATFSFTFTPLGDGGVLFAGGSLDTGHVGEARVLR